MADCQKDLMTGMEWPSSIFLQADQDRPWRIWTTPVPTYGMGRQYQEYVPVTRVQDLEGELKDAYDTISEIEEARGEG